MNMYRALQGTLEKKTAKHWVNVFVVDAKLKENLWISLAGVWQVSVLIWKCMDLNEKLLRDLAKIYLQFFLLQCPL